MIPSPQYPLYSGTLAVLGGRRVDYLLDEDAQWGINDKDLTSAYDIAVQQVRTAMLQIDVMQCVQHGLFSLGYQRSRVGCHQPWQPYRAVPRGTSATYYSNKIYRTASFLNLCEITDQAGTIASIIRFAHKRKLIIFADEVYQANVYGKIPFTSFKVLHQIRTVRCEPIPCTSFAL